MADKSFLSWPFFEDRHRQLAERLEAWCAKNLPVDHHDVDAACRELVSKLGRDGWLKPTAIDTDNPGPLDVRTLCITRETLAVAYRVTANVRLKTSLELYQFTDFPDELAIHVGVATPF